MHQPRPKKSEMLTRWDAAVVMQKAAAFRIARALGLAFIPVPVKGSHIGYLVPPALDGVPQDPLRVEVRVRSFPSTEHASTLIERRVSDLLTSRRTLYCEAFTDGMAVVYDLKSVEGLLSWAPVVCNAVSVDRHGAQKEKRPKVAAMLPYALGRMVRMADAPNSDPALPSNDVTKLDPVSGPLF